MKDFFFPTTFSSKQLKTEKYTKYFKIWSVLKLFFWKYNAF